MTIRLSVMTVISSAQSLRPGVQMSVQDGSPEYLSTYYQPVSGISGRRHLDFPRVKLASYRGRSFAYAGPSNWNSLPASLPLSSFKQHL